MSGIAPLAMRGLLYGIRTLLANGAEKPLRSKLNFIGATVVDDPANDRTNVTFSGGEGGGIPSDETPTNLGTPDPGAGTAYAREGHRHGHGNLAGGSLHSNAVAGLSAGFISGAWQQALELASAMLTAATVDPDPDTLPLRDENGDIYANTMHAGAVVTANVDLATAGELTFGGQNATTVGLGNGGSTTVLAGSTVEVNASTYLDLFDGATHAVRVTMASSLEVMARAGLTAFKLLAEQVGAGAGIPIEISAGKGFPGSPGGKLTLAGGQGGTPGSTGNAGGGVDILVRQQVGGTTEKIAFKEDSTEFLAFRRAGTVTTIESAGAVSVTASATTLSGSLACATISAASGSSNLYTTGTTANSYGRAGATMAIDGSTITCIGATSVTARGPTVNLDATTVNRRSAAGSTSYVTDSHAAAYTTTYSNTCTSITDSWTQAASGAGGTRTISGQKGASGQVGGSIVLAVGDGGTAGTNLPGDLILDLGTRVTGGNTGKIIVRRAGPNTLFDLHDANGSTYCNLAQPFYFLSNTFFVNAGSATVQSVSGGGIACGAGVDVGGTYAEFAGQMSGAFNVIAYAASLTINCNLSNKHEVTLTGNVTTCTVSNLRDGADFELHYVQDATGGRTVVWDTEFTFATGVSSAPATGANARTIFLGSVRNGVIYIHRAVPV